jgi:hypothetical protein
MDGGRFLAAGRTLRAFLRESARWALGPAWSIPAQLIVTSSAFVLVLVLRAVIIFASPYPPSSDVAGDLYNAHAWLGHALPAMATQPLPPPVYFFAVVTPFSTALPVFDGLRLYIVLVPALLTFPAYLWIRESNVRPLAALFGALLVALAAPFSLMLTWNGAYNLFGIFFLLFFLALFARTFRTQSRGPAALAGFSFALIAGTHQLTFVVAAIALVFAGLMVLATLRPARTAIRWTLVIAAIGVAAAAPFLYLDWISAHATVNVGLGAYQSNSAWAYANALYFGWGFQGGPQDFLAVADAALGVVALLNLLRHLRIAPFWATAFGVLGAALVVPLLDAGNAIRGLYFLPIAFVAGIPRLFEDVVAWRGWSRPTAPTPEPGRPKFLGKRLARADRERTLAVAVVVLVAATVLVANTAFSLSLMESSAHFYQRLSPAEVAALDWIRDDTPTNAAFFDSVGITTWIWAYADRMAFAPGNPALDVTRQSYSATILADLIQSGSYVTSDPAFVVGENFPGQVALPEVYVRANGEWLPLMQTQGDQVHFTVADASGGAVTVPLGQARLVGAFSTANATSATSTYDLWFDAQNFGIREQVRLVGDQATLSWSSNTSQLLGVHALFMLPPSGYWFDYGSVPAVANVSSVSDAIAAGTTQGHVGFAAASLSQSIGTNNWVNLLMGNGTQLAITLDGIPPDSSAPFASETGGLMQELGVSYVLVSSSGEYALYLRFAMGGPLDLAVNRAATFGDVTLFSVSYPPAVDGFSAGPVPQYTI